jgi:predicted phosphoribosyltransferase
MFRDRKDAGMKLARALIKYSDEDILVLAIPRGGVEVGYQVAKYLDADFSLLIARKLPYPDQPEAGFGAIAEDGSTVILEEASHWLPQQTIGAVIERQRQEIERRVAILRKGQPLPDMTGRTVILTDDGIAMGSTMRASIKLCKNQRAEKIVVAVPVAGGRIAAELAAKVDEIVVLEQPERFRAVAQVYEIWYDVPDSEVAAIMDEWQQGHRERRR